jgi:signal transduction histidine kinase/ActR/RegA family two-component response regulator
MRLRTVLALAFAAGAMLITLAATATVSAFIAARVQNRAEAQAAQLSEHLRQIIDANVAERLGDMAVLSSVARTNAATPQALRAWVDALHESYPVYAWIGFADRNGTVLASTDGLLEGESVAARSWFQQGLKSPTVSDIHEAKLLAKKLPLLPDGELRRFVDVAMPFRDASGSIVGVVGGHLSVPWLREMSRAAIAEALKREPNVEVLILAGDGTVVLGPGDQSGDKIEADLPALAKLAAGEELASARGVWPDGREYFTGASRGYPSLERKSLPWTVLIRQPVEIAATVSAPIISRLVLGGAAFTVLFALLGWWAAERLASPLLRLADEAGRIGQTPADARLSRPRGYREITELTDVLVKLLARLSERDRALAETNASLERRVSERTADLAEACERSEAAQAQAEAGERAKSEFLATMSHEVRTPLNAIVGFGDVLQYDASLTPNQRRCVEQMRVGCEVLTGVVNDILDYARIEAEGVQLEAAPFTLGSLVRETVDFVAGSAERKRLELWIEAPADETSVVLGDRTRLRQVLLNLVNNAVKFTERGRVTVTLTEAMKDDGLVARIAVQDTGIGISAEAQKRLFTRFAQADSTTTRRFGGTGLGLAIAKGLIEAMGGKIGVESREGEGATFWFEVALPLSPAQKPITSASDNKISAPSADTATSRQTHLLLVDDGAINREIAQLILEAMGYRVTTAENGQEALDAVQELAFDLVLMDVEMPVMDGITATETIRALGGAASRIPIIAMTAHVLPDHVALLRSAGVNDHVGKPFDRNHLRAVIQRCLSDARQLQAAA